MSSTVIVQSLYMVVLMQEDLEQAVSFYEQLGLKRIFHLPGKWAEFVLGSVRIGLCPADQVEKGRHTGVVFQVHNLQEVYQTLTAQGVEFAASPVTATHGIMASCFDPSGNRIDFYEPTHHKVKEALDGANKAKKDGASDETNEDGCCGKKEACC